ncbi:MAG: amidohydrolase family protein [Oscillospiraceae bacterium]|nr:amidohydrolase family protein [Oscillospiraceae bacterium]
MLIDFHTHAFSDQIAKRAMEILKETAEAAEGSEAVCYTDGTVSDLRKKLSEWGVSYGVMLPIATKPSQQRTINDWAASENKGNIISFGTVHPDAPDAAEELGRIKEAGLKGIKLHPDYQTVFLFEERMKIIYKRCEELGLSIVLHMGYDPISPIIRHAMPSHLPDITAAFPKLKIIAAHFGGMYAWEEVLHYVAGVHRKNIWLDTSYIAGYINPKLMLEIVKKHGADRILFASDCPWHMPLSEKELVESLPVTEKEKELIFYKNAAEILEL